ncbi:hypothetical protein J6590_083978 [Homalodisca vitripennis]|nr:hypothetical protein J6590_083978 [Homalodisca vitripennis]
MPGQHLFAKLVIEIFLNINAPVSDPSSAIMSSPIDRPPSTTGLMAAAELHHGAKSSSDATGPSDDTELVAAGPQHDAGLSFAANPPCATEPRDDPPVPAKLHHKPPATGLTNAAGPLSSDKKGSVRGGGVETGRRQGVFIGQLNQL